jgi:hypothetical protein
MRGAIGRPMPAGPAAEQPHLVLAARIPVTGEGSAPGGAAPFGVTHRHRASSRALKRINELCR